MNDKLQKVATNMYAVTYGGFGLFHAQNVQRWEKEQTSSVVAMLVTHQQQKRYIQKTTVYNKSDRSLPLYT